MSSVHTTRWGPYCCIVHLEGSVKQAVNGSIQGCVGSDVMEGQGDVHWILKRWKEPCQRRIADGPIVEEFVREVEHADIEYFGKVLPDRVRDSAKE